MDQASKRRGWPSPDAVITKPIAFNLEEALAVENTYRPNLLVIQHTLLPWEVTLTGRDSAIHYIRFLRIWFDLPQSVFFTAVTYLDLFISRMKVQERYLNCLAISCIYTAAEKEGYKLDMGKLKIAFHNICSMNDMLRMVGILKEKLNVFINVSDRSATCADFLNIYLTVLEYVSTFWEVGFRAAEILKREQLLVRLGVLLADSHSAFFRSSILALVLIKLELENYMSKAMTSESMYSTVQLLTVIRELQLMCRIKTSELVNCSNNASNVLKRYENHIGVKRSPNKMWNCTSNFIRGNLYRPFYIPLDTIDEQNQMSS